MGCRAPGPQKSGSSVTVNKITPQRDRAGASALKPNISFLYREPQKPISNDYVNRA